MPRIFFCPLDWTGRQSVEIFAWYPDSASHKPGSKLFHEIFVEILSILHLSAGLLPWNHAEMTDIYSRHINTLLVRLLFDVFARKRCFVHTIQWLDVSAVWKIPLFFRFFEEPKKWSLFWSMPSSSKFVKNFGNTLWKKNVWGQVRLLGCLLWANKLVRR